MTTRKAFTVKVRCTLNGADTTVRLWLPEDIGPIEAKRRASRYVPRHERNSLRLLSIELSPDQITRG